MIRKLGLSATAVALALGGIVAVASPASAGKPALGNATGSVTCSTVGKVKINPPLSSLNTLPSTTTAKTKSTSCTSSGGTIGTFMTGGKAKGLTTSTGTEPGTCDGVTGVGTTPFTTTITWKGNGATLNPSSITFANVGPSGVGFDLPATGAAGAATSIVTGSFGGNSAWAHATADPSVITALTTPGICTPNAKGKAKGLKKITIIGGTINVFP
jgi:hypothetical protein